MNTPIPEAPDPRRKQILEAAAALFFSNGYAATSIDAVIAQAGGSKRTIYELFGSKQGLFEALVQKNAAELYDPLDETLPDDEDLETLLIRFAVRFLTIISQPSALAVFRAAVAEQRRSPFLAEAFGQFGPKRGEQWLTRVLQREAAQGRIDIDNAQRTAAQFMGALRGNLYLDVVLSLKPAPTADEIRVMAQEGTQVFLRGILPR